MLSTSWVGWCAVAWVLGRRLRALSRFSDPEARWLRVLVVRPLFEQLLAGLERKEGGRVEGGMIGVGVILEMRYLPSFVG